MNLLHYYPSNKKSVALETLLLDLKKKGYNIIILTTCSKGLFHEFLEQNGIQTFVNVIEKKNPLWYYIRHIIFLIQFCKKHKIDVVYSHLQQVNIIAVFAQYFMKARVIIFRHHYRFNSKDDDPKLKTSKTEVWFDKIINRLAKKIIVASGTIKNLIIEKENVKPDKIEVIPYIYDFSRYDKPVLNEVTKIRQHYKCNLLLLMCSRLINHKRHHIVLPVVKKLITQNNLDIKLLILDEGPEYESISSYILENSLPNHVFMLGFKTDFINYMQAADILIHPSLTETSSSTIKEMGWLEKPVAVCSGVGDFDEYIIDKQNGFLMPIENTEDEIESILLKLYGNLEKYNMIGKNLKETVIEKYSNNSNTINLYEKLNSTNNV